PPVRTLLIRPANPTNKRRNPEARAVRSAAARAISGRALPVAQAMSPAGWRRVQAMSSLFIRLMAPWPPARAPAKAPKTLVKARRREPAKSSKASARASSTSFKPGSAARQTAGENLFQAADERRSTPITFFVFIGVHPWPKPFQQPLNRFLALLLLIRLVQVFPNCLLRSLRIVAS